ncbi:hypothetical protein AO262_27075 [Pseudomonas fluorescens ABAC62]|nr:hypothetical protein AO262_27075 [Pseudomonas fluorescens ABAC62]
MFHRTTPHPSQLLKSLAQAMQTQARHSQPRLLMPAHPVTQVITDPRPRHAALFPIHRQFQTLIQEALNPGQHSFASTTTTHVNVRIVGITHKAMTPTFQLSVEFVGQDVRQQRRERAALRRPLLPSADDPTRHDSSLEVAANQPEHPLVFDLTLDVGHQYIVVDPIKELLQIKFHTPAVSHSHMGAGCFDGLMSASARTKTVAVVREQRIEGVYSPLVERFLLFGHSTRL